jgi:O-antigen ligase
MIYLVKKNKLDVFFIILFSIYPIAVLVGNALINSFILITGIFYIFKLATEKSKIKLDIKKNFLLIFFFISLCINLFFTNDISLSYQRVVKIFFVIFFIFSFGFLIKNYYQYLKNIYSVWVIVFLIVILDLFIEFFYGKNILGQSSSIPGRLGSFTGEESVIGGFFLGFSLFSLSYFYERINKISINLFLAASFILISFFIGERANFIKTLIVISLFIIFVYKINYKIKLFSLTVIIFCICSIFIILDLSHRTSSFSEYKMRYVTQIKKILLQKDSLNFLENSQYGAHRKVAIEIFLDNPIFGVGIKNFRIESSNKKYDDLDHKKNHLRVANHPHELYHEFLSETGVFGLICFLIFIIFSIIVSILNYIKKKNIYQLSAIFYILVSILPILPVGSFLSTYNSSIFWINYAIMIGYNNMNNSKF